MDRLSKFVRTVIVVVAAVGVSFTLTIFFWNIYIQGDPMSIGYLVVNLLASKDEGMSEGWRRLGIAAGIDFCLYFAAICLLALVAEARHQRRSATKNH